MPDSLWSPKLVQKRHYGIQGHCQGSDDFFQGVVGDPKVKNLSIFFDLRDPYTKLNRFFTFIAFGLKTFCGPARIHWIYPPTQDSSHHQDYEPFLEGNPNLNLHLRLESWVGGVDRKDTPKKKINNPSLPNTS